MGTIKRFAINGRFLTRSLTGVDRYAIEMVKALDSICEKGVYELVVPACARMDRVELHNIEVKKIGDKAGIVWEQFVYPGYLARNSLIGINLCNSAPLLTRDIVCIHDMAIRANPSNYSPLFKIWYRVLFGLFTRRARLIVTVSEFSKREIERFYPSSVGRVKVVPNAWQHMRGVVEDRTVINRLGLENKQFCLALSSLTPNKNLKWIAETARLNPNLLFVVAGGINRSVFAEQGLPVLTNMIYPGYVTDGEAKALMRSCQAFIFPTFYEGFGIPPLEAASCGAKIIVSDTPVMHEVYEQHAIYVDPKVPCLSMERLINSWEDDSREMLLSKYSWKCSAKKLNELLMLMD